MSTQPKAPCHSCKGTGIDPTVGFLDCELCTPAPTPAGVSLSPPEQDLAKERRVILQADRVMRVYIAGPMTGLPEFNFPAFNAMAEVLRADGWHVENPAEHGHVDGAEWGDYLRCDISRLSTCSAMMLLPGWSSSRGARLEVSIAKELGHEILYAVDAEQMPTDFDRVTAERDALQQRLTAADEREDSLKNMLKQWMIAAHLGDVLVASHAKNITKQTADLLGLVVSDEFPQTNTSGKAHCPHDGICHESDETCADAVVRVESLKPAECCTVSAEDRALLAAGDYTPEELFGVGGKPSCPKCAKP